MHSDHEIFIEAVKKKRIIKLTYSNKDNLQNLSEKCAPLHYSKGRIDGDNLDSYYIWDFEAVGGDHFLSLFTPQIVSIEMSDKTFDLKDFDSHEKEKTIVISKEDSPA